MIDMGKEARLVELLFLLAVLLLLIAVWFLYNYSLEISPGVRMNIFELLLRSGR